MNFSNFYRTFGPVLLQFPLALLVFSLARANGPAVISMTVDKVEVVAKA